jgi:hypothetical protein
MTSTNWPVVYAPGVPIPELFAAPEFLDTVHADPEHEITRAISPPVTARHPVKVHPLLFIANEHAFGMGLVVGGRLSKHKPIPGEIPAIEDKGMIVVDVPTLPVRV